jgi:hypothetical protein
MRYRKKPVEINAWELTYNTDCIKALIDIIGENAARGVDGSLNIKTLEGVMTAVTGDYIIKGVKGEFYPCKPDIFKLTYEPVNANTEDK